MVNQSQISEQIHNLPFYSDLSDFTNDVLRVLSQEEMIRKFLHTVYIERTNQGPVQDKMGRFFDDFPCLMRMEIIERAFSNEVIDIEPEDLLNTAVEENELTQTQKEEFLSFRSSHRWIDECAVSHYLKSQGVSGLTEKEIYIEKTDHDQLRTRLVFVKGLDKEMDITIPLTDFLADVERWLQTLDQDLEQRNKEDGNLNSNQTQDILKYAEEIKKTLNSVEEKLPES